MAVSDLVTVSTAENCGWKPARAVTHSVACKLPHAFPSLTPPPWSAFPPVIYGASLLPALCLPAALGGAGGGGLIAGPSRALRGV